MAQGDRKGGLSVTANSITNPIAAVGSVAVAVGDLVVAVIAEQTAITATTVTDNLGNTYTDKSAGTDAGNITARAYYSRVTTAGTLTSVSAVATASSNNVSFIADVFEGPFETSPLDTNPANITSDVTSPFTCPSTGTLAQASELVVCFASRVGNAAFTATSPNLKGGEAFSQAVAGVTIGYQVVSATTAVAPEFTGTNPTQMVLGTWSFKLSSPSLNAEATQTTELPTQTATIEALTNRAVLSWIAFEYTAEPAVTNATATQTTALPTQVATALELVTASAAQTTALPTQNATAIERVSLTATQTTAVPTQTADASIPIVGQTNTVASQATSLPTQTATSTVRVTATATQTTGVPTQTATASERVSATATQATALPAQTVTASELASLTATQATALPTQVATASALLTGLNAEAAQTTALPTQTVTGTVRLSATATVTTSLPTQTAALQAARAALEAGQTTDLPSQTTTAQIVLVGEAVQITELPVSTAIIQYGVFRQPTILRTRSEDYPYGSRPAVIPGERRPWVSG
jgi:hypothetical protein